MLVWGKVIAVEPRAVPELSSKDTVEYFLHSLASTSSDDVQRVMACFVLAQCCAHGGDLRNLCIVGDLFALLATFCRHHDERLRVWCAIAAGNAWKEAPELLEAAQSVECGAAVAALHRDRSIRVRAACAYALGTIRKSGSFWHLPPICVLCSDGNAEVRREAHAAALACFQADPVEFRRAEDPRFAPLLASARKASSCDPDVQVRKIAAKSIVVIGASAPSASAKIGFTMGKKIAATPSSANVAGGASSSSANVPTTKSPKSPRSFNLNWKLKKDDGVNSSTATTTTATTATSGVTEEVSPNVSPRVSPRGVVSNSISVTIAPMSSCVDLELARIRGPGMFASSVPDPTEPRFLVAANLQQRHCLALSEAINRVSSHRRQLNQVPHDRELGRFGDGVDRITALCFAPGPPELLLVARGKSVAEWRERPDDKGEEEVLEDEEASSAIRRDSYSLVRRLAPEAEISSCAALNGHHFPLWALGCADGNVRVWGRDDIVASWMCEEEMTCLSFEATKSLLHVGAASSVQVWDCLSEQHVRSFSAIQSVTSIHALPGSSLSVAGNRVGQVMLLDHRSPSLAPVHLWHEQKSEVLGSSLSTHQTVVAGSSDGSLFFWDLRAPAHSSRSTVLDVGGKTGLGRCMS